MSAMDIRDTSKIYVMPIHHIRIGIAGGGDYYYNLEDGSQWSLVPITRPDDTGRQRIAGFKFEGTFIVLQNDYPNMTDGLAHLVSYKPSDFDLFLGNGYSTPWDKAVGSSDQVQGNILQISMDTKVGQTAPNCKSWSATPEFSQSKEAPRLTIKATGIFSTDILTKCDIFAYSSLTL